MSRLLLPVGKNAKEIPCAARERPSRSEGKDHDETRSQTPVDMSNCQDSAPERTELLLYFSWNDTARIDAAGSVCRLRFYKIGREHLPRKDLQDTSTEIERANIHHMMHRRCIW